MDGEQILYVGLAGAAGSYLLSKVGKAVGNWQEKRTFLRETLQYRGDPFFDLNFRTMRAVSTGREQAVSEVRRTPEGVWPYLPT